MDSTSGGRHESIGFLGRFGTFPLFVFVAHRLTLMLVSYMGLKIVPSLYYHEDIRFAEMQPYLMLDGLCRWDCGWYAQIATSGYSTPPTCEIWPLFPLFTNVVQAITRLPVHFALILSANLVGLASYYVILAIYRRYLKESAANWALVAFVAYPFSFFQAAGYAESTMVLLSALAVLLALNRRHLFAGVALGAGAIARHISLFAGVALLVASLRQRRWSLRRLLLSRDVFGLILPFFPPAVFIWYVGKKFGDPLIFWHARQQAFSFASFSVPKVFSDVGFDGQPELYFYVLFLLIPLVGTVLLFAKRAWLELACASSALMLVIIYGGAFGLGRFCASCWPAFLPLGKWLSRQDAAAGAWIGVMSMFQGLFFFLFSHQWRIL
jgi:Gpi18-like mannosyltransferase